MRSRTGRFETGAGTFGHEALGGISSPAGSCVWRLVGLHRSVREWAVRQGWGGRPVRQEQAQGILIAALAPGHRPVNRSGYAWPTGTLRPEELQYGCEEAAGAATGRPGSQAGRARLRPRAFAGERRCRRARLAQGTTVRHSRGVALGRCDCYPLREKPYSLIT